MVVEFRVPGHQEIVRTIREVAALPGELVNLNDGITQKVPSKCYWVVAKTNGIDSFMFGPLRRERIVGKVLHVFHVSKRCGMNDAKQSVTQP